MQITVRGYLTFKSSLGKQVIQLDGQLNPSLQDLLKAMAPSLNVEPAASLLLDPLSGEPQSAIAILLNGKHLAHLPDGLRTPLRDGDELAIFPPVAGG